MAFFGIDVRKAIALGEHRAIARHHHDHSTRALVLADPLLHQRIDHAGEVGRCQLKPRLRHCFVGACARRHHGESDRESHAQESGDMKGVHGKSPRRVASHGSRIKISRFSIRHPPFASFTAKSG
jgi:hypothetical protein